MPPSPPLPARAATAAALADSGPKANLRGMLWMVLAMAGFAVEDALLKQAARTLPIAQLLLMFGTGGAAIFWALGLRPGATPLWQPALRTRLMAVRAVFELTGRLFYVLAVALTPLSATTAILQATPVLVVLGARLVFGERVGWRRWLAVGVGLAGVLIVLRPASSDFSWASVLALIGLVGFAGRDLASRAVPRSLQTRHLGFYGFVTVALAGLLYGALWEQRAPVPPTPAVLGWLLAACAIGTGAYAALMKAMRTGDVAAVTPLRYSRLLFGVALGALVFGEAIDARMALGGAVILGSGLLIAWDGWLRAGAARRAAAG